MYAGSSKKMRPNKKLERRSDSTGSVLKCLIKRREGRWPKIEDPNSFIVTIADYVVNELQLLAHVRRQHKRIKVDMPHAAAQTV